MKTYFKRLVSAVMAVVIIVGMMSGYTVKAAITICDTYTGTNIGNYNYSRWSKPMESYIHAKDDGTFMRVQSGKNIDGLLVEYYDKDYNLTKHKMVGGELPIFGGFYASDNNYYVVTGQENPDASNTLEVYRVTKYDTDWNKIKSVSLSNCNTTVPFDAGSCRMDLSGDYLVIRTSHLMYSGHQANVTIQVNVLTMEITDSYTGVMNDSYGYVSHSFNQFIKIDNNKIVSVDHGDAYPRSIALIKYPTDISSGMFQSGLCRVINTMNFAGEQGNNTTGATVGGFELSDSKYLIAGNSVVQDSNFASAKTRNIFVTAVDKSTSEISTNWITDYAEGETTTTTPQMVKISSNTLMLLWTRGNDVYYTLIDGNGNRTEKIYSMKGKLSDCIPVYAGGKVVWYTWLNNVVTFYDIDVNNLSNNNETVIINGHNYSIIATGDGTADLKCSKCGSQITQKVITDMTIWWNQDGSYIHSTGLSSEQTLGQVINCNVDYAPSDANNEMEIISSDESVILVEMTDYNRARLTMADVGNVTITVRPKYNPSYSSKYNITVTGPLRIKSFISDKGTSAVFVDKINLMVNAAGGTGTLEYRFYEISESGETTVLRDYGIKSNYEWIPEKTGKRTLFADVKDAKGTVRTAQIDNVYIDKATAPEISDINKSYCYTMGISEEHINVAQLLPENISIIDYRSKITDNNGIIVNSSWNRYEDFVYKISDKGKVGNAAEIILIIESENYADIEIKLNIMLTDIISVEPEDGKEPVIKGSNVLTYGEKLSSLIIDSDNAVFVTASGQVVNGTISFVNPEMIPDAGTVEAAYVFRPDNQEYKIYEGSIAILVEKATPKISDIEADTVNYMPNMRMNRIVLKNGHAIADMAGQSVAVLGTWKWKNSEESIFAGISNRTVVFVPYDTNNYNISEINIDVNVLKGICTITELPQISALTYGEKLSNAQITGGKMLCHGQVIEGTFSWQNENYVPAVNNSTECILMFTPNDLENYSITTMYVSVTVNKAEYAPNAPQNKISVRNGITILSEVELPEGWSWEDGNVKLVEGEVLKATAVYKDSENYNVWKTEVEVLRLLCNHEEGDLIIDVNSDCQKKGLAHTECILCGLILRENIEVELGTHKYGDYTADDINNHHGKCEVCAKTIIEPHTWKIIKEEKSDKETITTYECLLCHARKEVHTKRTDAGDDGTDIPGSNGGSHISNGASDNNENTQIKVNTLIKAGSAVYRVIKIGKSGQSEVELTKVGTNAKSYVVPDFMVVKGVKYKITSIKAKACYKRKKLKRVIIGRYIKNIGNQAFYGCKNLKVISVKSIGLKKVGKYAIKGINKKAVIKVSRKKYKRYRKLFGKKSGFKKPMKIKK